MEEKKLFFEHLQKSLSYIFFSNEQSAYEFIEKNKGVINAEYSERFRSKIFLFPNGNILEIGRPMINLPPFLYSSLNDLKMFRKVNFFNNVKGELTYAINYDQSEINKVKGSILLHKIDYLSSKEMSVFIIGNNKIMTEYRDGYGSIYQTIDDYALINGFPSDDNDDNNITTINKVLVSDLELVDIKIYNSITNFIEKTLFLNNKSFTYWEKDEIVVIKNIDDTYLAFTDKNVMVKYLTRKYQIEQNKKVLLQDINISRNKIEQVFGIANLQFNVNGIKKIDSLVNTILIDDFFIKEMSNYLIRFVGEVLKRELKGSLVYDDFTNELKILLSDSTVINYQSKIYNEFDNLPFSSESIIEGVKLALTIKYGNSKN